ncbi:hypothetical protein HY389_02185 [Candidatus Daviesbacteria bacterium]|nr:hypothetical protein [Candidatus Daviesbacteria bacterium]
MDVGPAGPKQLEELITRIINLSTGLAFIVLTVMVFVGGIRYITSGDDPKSLSAAKRTLIWALLGILFLAIAWLILKLIAAFTGVDVTQFSLPQP